MRLQSLPALSLLFASVSLFVTSTLLQAQPSGGAPNEPTDPPAASRAALSLKTDAKPDIPVDAKPTMVRQTGLPLDELNRVLKSTGSQAIARPKGIPSVPLRAPTGRSISSREPSNFINWRSPSGARSVIKTTRQPRLRTLAMFTVNGDSMSRQFTFTAMPSRCIQPQRTNQN